MKDKAISEIAKLLFDSGTAGKNRGRSIESGDASPVSAVDRDRTGDERDRSRGVQTPAKVHGRGGSGRNSRAVARRSSAVCDRGPDRNSTTSGQKDTLCGYLKDGKTRGFWMLMLATPYRGRGLPCGFVTYSSATISQEVTSRNQYHFQAFRQVKDLLGERPLVLDREFSYLELLQAAVTEKVNFVIRLKYSAAHPVHFTDVDGQEIKLRILPGKTEIYSQIFYKGVVQVNVIGTWDKGFEQPLWVMTSLSPEAGLDIYQQRMKIELSFRDLKSLLGMDKLMNKRERWMQQSLALLMLAFAIGLVTGELLRDLFFGDGLPPDPTRIPPPPSPHKRKWRQFSGLFIFLKIKRPLLPKDSRAVLSMPRVFLLLTPFPRCPNSCPDLKF